MSDIPLLRAPTPDNPSSVSAASPSGPAALPNSTFTAPTNPKPFTPAPTDESASAYLKSLLDQYGLGSEADWANQELIAGHSPEMILQELYQRPAFKARFPSIDARRRAGLNPMSVAEIISWERQARDLLHAAGLPPGFYDSQDALQDFIGKGVSISELSNRIQLAAQDYFNADPTVTAQLDQLYGLTPGHHIAFFLDPTTALPLIERDFTAAQLSAAAIHSSFGGLSRTEAEGLVGLGTNPDQALRGFSQLAQSAPLFTPLPGEPADAITRAQQIAATFYQDASALTAIQRRQMLRLAPYQASTQFAASQGGVVGLGSNVT